MKKKHGGAREGAGAENLLGNSKDIVKMALKCPDIKERGNLQGLIKIAKIIYKKKNNSSISSFGILKKVMEEYCIVNLNKK